MDQKDAELMLEAREQAKQGDVEPGTNYRGVTFIPNEEPVDWTSGEDTDFPPDGNNPKQNLYSQPSPPPTTKSTLNWNWMDL